MSYRIFTLAERLACAFISTQASSNSVDRILIQNQNVKVGDFWERLAAELQTHYSTTLRSDTIRMPIPVVSCVYCGGPLVIEPQTDGDWAAIPCAECERKPQ